MGALVPVLFAVSRQARMQAAQEAVAKDREIEADIAGQRETVQWRTDQLRESKQKTEAEIATARLELGHLEDHTRRLKAQAEQLEKTLKDFGRTSDETDQAVTEDELKELYKQITEAERQVAEAKAKSEGKKRSFAIVPYEGPNSTHRRPIYIECRADAIVLQPECIVLSVHDFEGPMGPSNPLAMALRTEREYLLSQRGFDPKRDGEPYPLLLVRPDGVVAYYAARMAMKNWGAEFGYEFIEADWKLAYQPPDPQLARMVQDAVESARVVQQRLIAAAPREYSRRPASGSNGSPGRGGGGSGPGGSYSGPAGGPSGGTGSGTGRGPGGAGGGPGGSFYSSFGGDDEGGGDFAVSDNKRHAPQGPDPFLAGVNNPYTSLVGGGPGSGIPGGSGMGSLGFGGTSSGGSGGTGLVGPGGTGSGAGPALGSPLGNGGTGSPGSMPGGNGEGVAGGGYPQGAGGNGNVGISQGGSGGNAGGGSPGGYATPQGSYNGQGQLSGGGNNPSRQAGVSQGSAVADKTESQDQNENREKAVTAAKARRSNEPPDIFASRVAAENAAKNKNELRTTQDTPPDGDYQVASPLRPGEWRERPAPPPELPKEKEKDKKDKKRKPPRHYGQDWALRDAEHGSVPITRPVVLECRADKLVLMPERGQGGNPMVVMASGADSSIDDLVSALWDRMNYWGLAGRGMYWRPVLHIRVSPDGEQRFSDLQTLLQGSGLELVRQ